MLNIGTVFLFQRIMILDRKNPKNQNKDNILKDILNRKPEVMVQD